LKTDPNSRFRKTRKKVAPSVFKIDFTAPAPDGIFDVDAFESSARPYQYGG
jgi:hypothetical protein